MNRTITDKDESSSLKRRTDKYGNNNNNNNRNEDSTTSHHHRRRHSRDEYEAAVGEKMIDLDDDRRMGKSDPYTNSNDVNLVCGINDFDFIHQKGLLTFLFFCYQCFSFHCFMAKKEKIFFGQTFLPSHFAEYFFLYTRHFYS